MLLQRVDNIAGLVGMESSPFGTIYGKMLKQGWDFPFNWITVRTWRHIAKYAGAEAEEGADWRLPWLMEDVFEAWDKVKHQPQFKAEYFVTIGAVKPLGEAARATARRLGLDAAATEALVARFQGYPRELSGPGVRPVPPLLYGINAGSRDHTIERYRDLLLPELAAMDPAPKVRVMRFGTGVHNYERAEDGLPRGTLPAVVEMWDRAITGGYYLP
jgi:hypothetical protein